MLEPVQSHGALVHAVRRAVDVFVALEVDIAFQDPRIARGCGQVARAVDKVLQIVVPQAVFVELDAL